jgi:hypothetical protein
MRILFLALVLATPVLAQQRTPVAYSMSPGATPVAASVSLARSDTSLSLGRHILVGLAVGLVATGAGFLIEGALNENAYDDCMMCPIVVPIVIGAGGAVGGIGGAIVYGIRRLSSSASAPRAAPEN